MNYKLDGINGGIRRILANKDILDKLSFKSFNGAPIPFIGPEWIDIDFSLDYCFFSVIPKEYSHNIHGRNLVGFCEDMNFDNYPQVKVDGKKWRLIKDLLIEAVSFGLSALEPGCKDLMPYFYNLNFEIQTIGHNLKFGYDQEYDVFYIIDEEGER
ncbi:MAG: hypothetical protein KA802_09315 [Saprospiraceae bacterium]|nr:hypothetical protein [Saprospiraceae bacterium]